MTKVERIALFITLVVVGLSLQKDLGMLCRCHWAVFNSRMIYGAMVVDAWVTTRLIVAASRRRFLTDCVMAGIIVVTSPIWIPIIFKAVAAFYLLPKGDSITSLFH